MITHYGPDATLPGPAPEPTLTALITLGHSDSQGRPLPSGEVATAQGELYNLIRRTIGTTLLANFSGEGWWEGESEQSTGWLILAPLSFLVALRDELLPTIAYRFQQESIGLVVHDTDFAPESYVCADR